MRVELHGDLGLLQDTRYLVEFASATTLARARSRIRMPAVQGQQYLCAATDIYLLHETCLALGEPVDDCTLEQVRQLRNCAQDEIADLARECGRELYPYQVAGATFLQRTRVALLLDQMGLGKTVQALMALPRMACGIVVAPKSLLRNWVAEATAWRPDLRFEACDRSRLRGVAPGESIVATPDAVRGHYDASGIVRNTAPALPRSYCILDEAHYYKSAAAKRTEAISRLVTHYDNVWCLTGTPLTNTPADLWGLLDAVGVGHAMFGGWPEFMRVFGGYVDDRGIKWPPEVADPDALEDAFRGRALRRMRSVVAPEIPGKTHVEIQTEVPSADADERKLVAMFEAAQKDAGPSTKLLGMMSKMRAALSESKIPAMLELVSSFVDSGTHLVVCSANTAPLLALQERYGCPLITGSTPGEDRHQAVVDFQSGQTKLIGINPQAGGTGITLTAACHMLFVQRDWSPAVNDQAEDRICRIGQLWPCTIYDIVSDHPLDVRVFASIRRKSSLISHTMSAVQSA